MKINIDIFLFTFYFSLIALKFYFFPLNYVYELLYIFKDSCLLSWIKFHLCQNGRLKNHSSTLMSCMCLLKYFNPEDFNLNFNKCSLIKLIQYSFSEM